MANWCTYVLELFTNVMIEKYNLICFCCKKKIETNDSYVSFNWCFNLDSSDGAEYYHREFNKSFLYFHVECFAEVAGEEHIAELTRFMKKYG